MNAVTVVKSHIHTALAVPKPTMGTHVSLVRAIQDAVDPAVFRDDNSPADLETEDASTMITLIGALHDAGLSGLPDDKAQEWRRRWLNINIERRRNEEDRQNLHIKTTNTLAKTIGDVHVRAEQPEVANIERQTEMRGTAPGSRRNSTAALPCRGRRGWSYCSALLRRRR